MLSLLIAEIKLWALFVTKVARHAQHQRAAYTTNATHTDKILGA